MIDLLIIDGVDGVVDGWPDVEGASLIRTMQKTWGDNMPTGAGNLFYSLVRRRSLLMGTQPGADESFALAVAHLLPGVIRCVLPVVRFVLLPVN